MSQAQRVPQCSTVRTYQRGNKWWFDVRVGGRRVRRPGGRTQAQAEASGAQFVASGAQKRAAGTVGATFDAWLAFPFGSSVRRWGELGLNRMRTAAFP
jgi:hypothetical protein